MFSGGDVAAGSWPLGIPGEVCSVRGASPVPSSGDLGRGASSHSTLMSVPPVLLSVD